MNRTHTHSIPRVYWIFTALLTVAAAAVGGIAVWLAFDAQTGYFTPGVWPILMTVLIVVAAVGAVVAPCLTLRQATPSLRALSDASVGTRCLSFLLAADALFYGLMTLIAPPAVTVEAEKFITASGVTAIGAAVYFVWAAMPTLKKHGTALLLLGFLPVAWSISVIALTYFDLATPMNSPIKLTTQFGFAALMLLITTELRLHLGEPAPRLAMAVRGLTAFLCISGGATLTVTVHALTGKETLCHGATLLLVGLYALLRMADDAFHPLPMEEETPHIPTEADVAVVADTPGEGEADATTPDDDEDDATNATDTNTSDKDAADTDAADADEV